MNIVFFIGMPGAGKSYWCKTMAEHMNLAFADIDDMIEEREQMSIADIFEQKGETYFREKETDILIELINNRQDIIVACGGGTPVFDSNLKVMKEAGCLVYLDVNLTTLAERIVTNSTPRPLLAGSGNTISKLQGLFNERKAIYEEADYILDDNNITVTNLEQIIQSCINRH